MTDRLGTFLALLLFIIITTFACNDNSTGSTRPPDCLYNLNNLEGITRTTPEGEILEEDPRDWCPTDQPHTEYGFTPAWPNPSSAIITFEFSLPVDGSTSLVIVDSTCTIVKTLVDRNSQAGSHRIEWNGTNGSGEIVPNGVYRCFLEIDEFSCSGDVQISHAR